MAVAARVGAVRAAAKAVVETEAQRAVVGRWPRVWGGWFDA